MKLEKNHGEQGKTLSYCELNLETWRQLWRVLEISDIILVIVDARYPVNKWHSMEREEKTDNFFSPHNSRYIAKVIRLTTFDFNYRACCFRPRCLNTSRKH